MCDLIPKDGVSACYMDHFSQVLFYKDPFKSTIFTRSHAESLGDSKKAVSRTCDCEFDVLKVKVEALVIAPLCRHGLPQRRLGTWRAPSSVAHTCLIPSQT